jgi:hypothetical protein
MGRVVRHHWTNQPVTRLRRQVETLKANTGMALPHRTCILDDSNPSFYHVLHGSREGIACLERRDQAVRRDLQACHLALKVAGRAMLQEKTRADRLEGALRQERAHQVVQPRGLGTLQRIQLILTPPVLDGLTIAALFITLFAVLVIPHIIAGRMADRAQVENLARKGVR